MQFPLREAAARTSLLLGPSRNAAVHLRTRLLSISCTKCLDLGQSLFEYKQRLYPGRVKHVKTISGKSIKILT